MFVRACSVVLSACILTFALPSFVLSHCQIPCGIYHDHARVVAMQEDVATIEKSVRQILSLAGKSDPQSLNQQVRWVNNKEVHAQRIIDTISAYFLTQRIMPSQQDYGQRLKAHHLVILLAMKNKQQVDLATVQQLKGAVNALEEYYAPSH